MESRPQTPINTTVIGDYYLSAPDKEGKKDARMESFLAAIEGMAKPILDSWRTDPSQWDEEGKSIIAMFLSFMHSRAPRAVEVIKEMNMAGLEHVMDEMKKLSMDPAKLKRHYDKFRVSEDRKRRDVSLELFERMMSNPREFGEPGINEKYAMGESFNTAQLIYRHLMNMTWSICAIQNERFFVIGDAPMVVFAQTDEDKAIFGAGFGLPNIEITFPLSPKLCLWIDRRRGTKYRVVGANFVEEVNRRSIHMAERVVISTYKSNRIQGFVKESAVYYGKPKIDAKAFRERFIQRKVGFK